MPQSPLSSLSLFLPPQIVAMQTMLEMMAERFPGCLSGYNMHVIESHQATKADTSGTALANIASFKKMGLDFDTVGWSALGGMGNF